MSNHPLIIVSRRFLSSNTRDPLKILFFGTDEFSNLSLNALHQIKTQHPETIEHLQVVTKPSKWCGRHHSTLYTPAITPFVESLPDMPAPIPYEPKMSNVTAELSKVMETQDINMIIAVSFGHLIPASLINSSKYALNVHPSLLPRYKGSSPLQYTLLNNDTFTGVTVQELHPTKFDAGKCVAQTDPIKLEPLLKDHDATLTPGWETRLLRDRLGRIGADLLSRVILNGTYLPGCYEPVKGKYEKNLAPMIKKDMCKIDWGKNDAFEISNKFNVLGPVFTFVKSKKGEVKRVLFHEVKLVEYNEKSDSLLLRPGQFIHHQTQNAIYVKSLSAGRILKVKRLQFEGFAIEDANLFSKRLKKRCGYKNTEVMEQTFVNILN
ncbi:hypothetical protein NCAS_0B06820 [Naumovozyma castellii]|uniref:Methionyl-tRNA formyltransferase, mitochondrial n=1 Tax=Naumovozyma castellii TaxID=27288 RepID=G0VA36_NAUCA|nr:hypothetical protein NCAS_0B06820 [Naumovozyma castellii CBS 4309]CCC68766.1 hypothetical protein NCAS_0B06820 [Naumovozyma castellii CBS 4309]